MTRRILLLATTTGYQTRAFGEAAAWPVQAFLAQFWNEFEYAIVNKRFYVDDVAAGTVVPSIMEPSDARKMSRGNSLSCAARCL